MAHGRREERLTINKEFDSFDQFIQEYVTNISATGAFIKSKTPLEVGTLVNLRFTVIMDDIETIMGTGRVVRVSDDPPGMGVVFEELNEYSQNLILKLLTSPSTETEPTFPNIDAPEGVREGSSAKGSSDATAGADGDASADGSKR
jgi:hypothetical protein